MNPEITPSVHVDHGGINDLPDHRSPSPKLPPVMTELRRQQMTATTTTAAGLCKELGLDTALVRAVAPVLIQNLVTLEKKQRDYGPHNLTKFGTFGVIVRMGDKMERIVNMSKKAGSLGLAYGTDGHKTLDASTHNEPLADSFLDLANYALIAYVMQQNLWPDENR